MSEMLAFCRLVLATVFAIAALAKQVDAEPWALGWPDLTGWPLRAAEVTVAGLLLPGATSPWGVLGAMSLALGFVAFIGHSMSRGQAGQCGCFGGLDRDLPPLISLFRAAVILTMAGWGVMESRSVSNPDVWSWLGSMEATQRATTLLGVSLFAAALAMPGRITTLLRQVPLQLWNGSEPGTMVARPVTTGFPRAGLAVGAAAPDWPLLTAMMATSSREGIRDESHAIVLFVGPAANDARLAVRACDGRRLIHVSANNFPALADHYRVPAVPSAVLVSATGVVASYLAVGPRAIAHLCLRAAEMAAAPDAAPEREAPSRPTGAVAAGCAGCGR